MRAFRVGTGHRGDDPVSAGLILPWGRATGLPTLRQAISSGRVRIADVSTALFILYLSTFVFDAVLRYLLNLGGLAAAIYLRDLVPVLLVLLVAMSTLRTGRAPKLVAILLGLFALFSLSGFFIVRSIPQIGFEVKVLASGFVGAVAAATMDGRQRRFFENALVFLWVMVLVGLLLDVSGISLPWRGLMLEINGVEIEGQREWQAGAFRRLAGFGRASFDTAMALFFFPFTFLHRFRPIWRWVVLVLSFGGLVLTTSKGTMLASVAGFGLMAAVMLRIPFRRFFWACLLASCMAIMILPTLLFEKTTLVDRRDPIVILLFGSFMDRIESTWPHAYSLVETSPFPWLGRGIGGLGATQSHFEPAQFNPGDNFFVFLWVTFGIVTIPLLLGLARFAIPRGKRIGPEDKIGFVFVSSLMILGLGMNIIESAMALSLLTFFVGKSLKANRFPCPLRAKRDA